MHLTFMDYVFRLAIVLIAVGYSSETMGQVRDELPLRVEDNLKTQIEEILDLLSTNVTFPHLEKAIFVFGNDFSEKTTLLQLLAGDNSQLISVDNDGEFYIEDQQNRPPPPDEFYETVSPELIVDPVTNSTFYDCAALDIGSTANAISATYFTNKATQSVDLIKLVFVINHASLKVGVKDLNFFQLLTHISEFVIDIETYKNSMVLIVTKIVNSYSRNGSLLTTDKNLMDAIYVFLREKRNELIELGNTGVPKKDSNLKTRTDRHIQILDIFLSSGKIALSREPEVQGAISEDKLVQEGKKKIFEVINDAIFSPVGDTGFGFTVGDKTKISIDHLLSFVVTKADKKIYEAFQFWENERQSRIEASKNWTEIKSVLDNDFDTLVKFKANLILANSTSDLAVFLRDASFKVGLDLSLSLVSKVIRYDGYVNFFNLVGNIDSEFSSERFRPGLDSLMYLIEKNRLWYGFLLTLLDYLGSYEIQLNKELYNTSDFANWGTNNHNREGISVIGHNFNTFFDKVVEKAIVLKEFGLVKTAPLTKQQINELDKVFTVTLKSGIDQYCTDDFKRMIIKGHFVIMRNNKVSMACYDRNNKVTIPLHRYVFASSTVFIDEDITVNGEVFLSIFAPRIVVLGKASITMKGESSTHMYDTLRKWEKINTGDCDDGQMEAFAYLDNTLGAFHVASYNFTVPELLNTIEVFNIEDFRLEYNKRKKAVEALHKTLIDAMAELSLVHSGKKVVCNLADFSALPQYTNYITPRPSMPGFNAGKLLIVAGSGFLDNLILKSNGGSGGVGDYGSSYSESTADIYERQTDPTVRFTSRFIVFAQSAGIGGAGGFPGVVNFYLLDNGQSCTNRCLLSPGDTGRTGAFGRTKDKTQFISTRTNQSPPKAFNGNVKITDALAYYKETIHSYITPLNFGSLTTFWDKMDANLDLQNFSNTLDFVQELMAIVSESHTDKSISNRALSARYSSLMRRLEIFSKSLTPTLQIAQLDCTKACITKFVQTSNENSTSNKRALFTMYTLAALQIDFLKETNENGLVVDISSFFEVSIKELKTIQKINENIKQIDDLKKVSEKMTSALSEYKGNIDKDIEQASALISNTLKPSIDKMMEKLNEKIGEILQIIQDRKEDTANNIKTVESNNKKLADHLKVKKATFALNMIGDFLAVVPKVGPALSTLVKGVSTAVDGFSPGVDGLAEQTKQIGEEATKTKNQLKAYLSRLPDEVDISAFFEELLDHMDNLPVVSGSYETLKSNMKTKIAEYRNEVSKDSFNLKVTSAIKNQIKDLLIEIGKRTPGDGRLLGRKEGEKDKKPSKTEIATKAVKSLGKTAEKLGSIGTFLKDISKIEGDIKNGEKVVGELKELNAAYDQMKSTVVGVIVPMLSDINFIISLQTTGIKNVSSIAAYVKGYQVTSSIRTLRNELQVLLSSLNLEGALFLDITHIVTEIEMAMQTVSGVQEKAAVLRGNQKIADLMNTFATSQIDVQIPPALSQSLIKIEAKIKTGSALWYYKLCRAAFIQEVFPFAHKYKNDFNLPADIIKKDPSFAVGEALTQLENLQTLITVERAQIKNNEDKRFSAGGFRYGSTVPGPFYIWDGVENQRKVGELLSGKPIYLDANILQGLDNDAIKFNEINFLLVLKSDNETLVKQFNSALQNFYVHLTHSGNGFYRFEGKYYTVLTTLVDIGYTFENKRDGTPQQSTKVFKKLQKGDLILSPYTLWKFNLTAEKEKYFDLLKPFLNSTVDLVLEGEGSYLRPTYDVPTDLQVGKYYKEVEGMQGLASAGLKPEKVENGRKIDFVRKGRRVWASTSPMGKY